MVQKRISLMKNQGPQSKYRHMNMFHWDNMCHRQRRIIVSEYLYCNQCLLVIFSLQLILLLKDEIILPVRERATKQSKKSSTKQTKQSKSSSKSAKEKACSGEERIVCGRGKRLLVCLHKRDETVCMKENRIPDHLSSHPNDYCGRCNQNEVPTSSPSRSPTVSLILC